jgi:hypothetical protein
VEGPEQLADIQASRCRPVILGTVADPEELSLNAVSVISVAFYAREMLTGWHLAGNAGANGPRRINTITYESSCFDDGYPSNTVGPNSPVYT